MWPLYMLLNKNLKTEEEKSSGIEHLNSLDSYLHDQSSSNSKSSLAALPRLHFVEVPHVNQLYSWDCGLACVLMVLRTLGIDSCNIQSLRELCSTTSIWTVDLAYILKKFSINFSYFTVTYGANPNYSMESYYEDQLANDLVRVDMLFQRSLEDGINIQCRSISKEEISHLILSGKHIAIALVNQHRLSRTLLKDIFVTNLSGNSGYTGHFIVICGYDSYTDEFEIRDPASPRKQKMVSSKCLEEARKSFGTDEDLLLISLEKSRTPNINMDC